VTIIRLVTALAAVASPSASTVAQPVVFVVRHAEKQPAGKDPALSPAGEARARALAALLGNAEVGAIYTSELRRTAQTAEPLAKARGIAPRVFPARDVTALVRVLREHPSERALVVGHSDTVPKILAALGCSEKITLADQEYDALFVVVPHEGGGAMLVRLRY
jgi:broad specificity phosphatase PhoE